IGLDLRPRKLREAADLWRKLTDASDVTVRDGVWGHPDLLPDGEDIDSPAAFIDRVIGGDSSLDDAIAELERSLAQDDEKPDDKGDDTSS
ncbi:MAG: zinc-dependent metalloprotease, partial [Gordonia sp. (in: high G+C Gram-positive bacteria)]|nr:zinc-dependent metalloprotease [Gordonia sp. (in: high G+C Gram-positive bacteria)]